MPSASRCAAASGCLSIVLCVYAAVLAGCNTGKASKPDQEPAGTAAFNGFTPHPVTLRRPVQHPLSPLATLGKAVFFDSRLSISQQQSCASCHSPAHAFGPPDGKPAQFGGPELKSQGQRAVPGLSYLEAVPVFEISVDDDDSEAGEQEHSQTLPPGTRPQHAVVTTASKAPAVVPRGGLFWDGRVNTLIAQAAGPLMNPLEMGNTSLEAVTAKLETAAYRDQLVHFAGDWVLKDPQRLATEALYAVSRYQIEDLSFHPYTSKFDYWLEGKAAFTPEESRGFDAFNDPKAGNCAACHLDAVRRDGGAPLFTDYQYEALGVPRNPELAANHDPDYYDLGLCGPIRNDLKAVSQYCGMFRTPSLRNVALRTVFFHNGRYHSLEDVLAFYNFRDTAPGKIYPRKPDGDLARYDDLPSRYWSNVDTRDAPFDRHAGDAPAMSDRNMRDIIAFLKTLTDGYQPVTD